MKNRDLYMEKEIVPKKDEEEKKNNQENEAEEMSIQGTINQN